MNTNAEITNRGRRTDARTIENLKRLVDQLRQPFNNSPTHAHLYWRACNALNRLEEQGCLESLDDLREDGLN